ncbi:MAG: hypothetical protein ACPGSB_10755 [Opitutales bacterium]
MKNGIKGMANTAILPNFWNPDPLRHTLSTAFQQLRRFLPGRSTLGYPATPIQYVHPQNFTDFLL